jgi:polyphosphate glucokinase
MEVLGIDIGGSGIKGAPVDTERGTLLTHRYRIPTPNPSKPKRVAKVLGEIVAHFNWTGPVGCGFPAVVQNGVVLTAANVNKRWIGTDAEALFSKACSCPIRLINDADAAGTAEMAFGSGRGRKGVVLIVTIGTGLGTSVFTDGHLMPNSELGHIEIQCEDAEKFASDAARKRKKLSWKKWTKNLDEYLCALEKLIWPDLIILGGGVSKKHDRFVPHLSVQAEVVPALMLNEAGIIGAALAAKSLAPMPTSKENL